MHEKWFLQQQKSLIIAAFCVLQIGYFSFFFGVLIISDRNKLV